MSTGIVKWFNDSKGFGFIAPADGSAVVNPADWWSLKPLARPKVTTRAFVRAA